MVRGVGPEIPASVMKALAALGGKRLPVFLDFSEYLESSQAVEETTNKAPVGDPIIEAALRVLAKLPEDKVREIINFSAGLAEKAGEGPIIIIGGPLISEDA